MEWHKNIISEIGRTYIRDCPSLITWTSGLRTSPSLLGNTLSTSPVGQWLWCTSRSFKRTTLPTWMLSRVSFHFRCTCRLCRYSCFQQHQNFSAKELNVFPLNVINFADTEIFKIFNWINVFWVSKTAGDKTLQGRAIQVPVDEHCLSLSLQP